jgi:hypothetical protein
MAPLLNYNLFFGMSDMQFCKAQVRSESQNRTDAGRFTICLGASGIDLEADLNGPTFFIYIPVAKTRIPAAPVTCERICGST